MERFQRRDCEQLAGFAANLFAGLNASASGGAVGIAGVYDDGSNAAAGREQRRAANFHGSGDDAVLREQRGGRRAADGCRARLVPAGREPAVSLPKGRPSPHFDKSEVRATADFNAGSDGGESEPQGQTNFLRRTAQRSHA